MKYIHFIQILIIAALFITGCEKDDPDPVNEEELITTVRVDCIPVGGGDAVSLSFRDPDGDGGDAPVIDGGTFMAGTVYLADVSFLNESVTPAEDISEEVREEGDEHQVFLAFSDVDFTFRYLDADADGLPVGLEMELQAGVPGAGTLTLILRHEPEKSAAGVADGELTNAGGETDVEVTFPVEIVN